MKQCVKCEEIKFNFQMYKFIEYHYGSELVSRYTICKSCVKEIQNDFIKKYLEENKIKIY